MAASVLVIPGLLGSGPDHWQTRLEGEFPTARRVEQKDWARPDRSEWVATLDRAIRECAEAPILVAHSLGCVTAAAWASDRPQGFVRGALLVAPSDVERADAPEAIRGFSPIPMMRLPFPSVLVASSDDPFLTVARSRELAVAWGSRWLDIGPAGHVNAASGFGPWPAGEALVRQLADANPAERGLPPGSLSRER